MGDDRIEQQKPHLAGLLPEEIQARLVQSGYPARADEARRLLAHAISPTARRDAYRRPLGKLIVSVAAELFDWSELSVVEEAADPADGFVKYLFRHADGALSEAVRIPLHKPGCFSVCLSSQVGCAMGCAFCATARLGFTRNLTAAEMVSAFIAVRDRAPGRVTGAVFMGQGEPLANYDEVMRAAAVLAHPCGGRIAGDAVTISTVGLVPQIRRFARERRPHRLIVSLNSAIPEKRARLMPAAARYSLDELAGALREYGITARNRVTVAWVMIAGVNTGKEEVEALKALLGDLRLRVNLIDLNEIEAAPGFKPVGDDERGAFMDELQVLGVPLVRRYSGGANGHAACGMLAARRLGQIGGSGA